MVYYTMGKVETRHPVYVQYGYIEARMKIPYRKGLCSSFWTFRRDNGWLFTNAAEIDIVEVFGGKYPGPNTVTTCIHRGYVTCTPPINDGDKVMPHTLSSAYSNWHTYAIEWNKDRIIWYINGKPVRLYNNHGIIDPVMLIFSILIEEKFLPPTTGSWTEYMYVDYVKVYSLKCDKNTVVNEISNFNTYNYAVKKSIAMSNATTIPAGSNIALRATDFIELKPGFEVQTGRELYLDVTPCEVKPEIVVPKPPVEAR